MAKKKPTKTTRSVAKKKPAATKARKAPAKKTKKTRFALKGLLFKVALVGMLLSVGWVVYLDAWVTDKFEGKRWSLPAQVYARPLELYVGQNLDLRDVQAELNMLGYRKRFQLSKPGQYAISGGRLDIYTRSFRFWNEAPPAQRVSLSVKRGVVTSLSAEGAGSGLLSLEPLLVGGIYPAHNEDRLLIQLEDVPQFLVDALITVEDNNFYSHHGVSPKSIARAMWVNAKAGRAVQGGSTLTQQLVKNFYLSSERSLMRKGTEAVMSLLLDAHYDKDEILEAYLNEVYLGQAGRRAVHGFGLGSQYYFGRSINELKLHQAALLVSLVKGPSYYNPRRHPERALARRNLVLGMLAKSGMVTEREAQSAKAMPLDVAAKSSYSEAVYPAYIDLVKRQLQRDYRAEDLTSEGLRIFTSLDPLVQRDAEQSLTSTAIRLKHQHGEKLNKLEGAMVVTSTDTGEVLALVGGKDTKYSGFNRALDAVRPVGSVLKPAVYLAALSQPERYQLTTLLDDDAVTIELENGDLWQPLNADKKDHGQVPLHRALAHSYNQATARLGMEVGLPKVMRTISNLGINRPLPAYPSVMLGAVALSPLEVAAMYQTIAAGGFDTPLRAIRAVSTAEGEPLNRYPLQLEQKVDSDAVHLLYYALQETMREGTGRSVYASLPENLGIAGKTGTTDDLRDSWFAGFTGDRLAVVWLGNDDNTPLGLSGSSGALKVWQSLMLRIHPQSFVGNVPENINYQWVDDETGLLSGRLCKGARQVPFIKGSEPREKSDCAPGLERMGDWIKSWF